MTEAYVGIDVAIAKGKVLPIVVCIRQGGALVPLSLKALGLPGELRGRGNVATLEAKEQSRFAAATVGYLKAVEREFKVRIARIGIDAPRAPRPDNLDRRKAEDALAERKISCFKTPSESEFKRMPKRVRAHLAADGTEARIPCSNQIWMLFGFELFRVLTRQGWKCLEVYPQATVKLIGAGADHKFKKGAVLTQLSAASKHTAWPPRPSLKSLVEIGFGSPHDRLDAYLAAWVASLAEQDRRALGLKPNDVIWVPKWKGPDS